MCSSGPSPATLPKSRHVNFEREDRFRREQIERVASIAHGYDSLTKPLVDLISAVETRQPGICRFMPVTVLAEQKLQKIGLLKGRLFSPGPVNFNDTAEYGRQLDTVEASDGPAKDTATFLKTMISQYVEMLAQVETADADFAQKREAFQATLMFEVKVYFPRTDTQGCHRDRRCLSQYRETDRRRAIANMLCKVDAKALQTSLIDLNVRSTREMIAFAQTLEPELGDKTIQR